AGLCPRPRRHRVRLRAPGQLRVQRALSERGVSERPRRGDSGRGAGPAAPGGPARAASLCPTLADPLVALAWNSFIFDRDWATTEVLYQRALRLDPSSAIRQQYYGVFISPMGRVAGGCSS